MCWIVLCCAAPSALHRTPLRCIASLSSVLHGTVLLCSGLHPAGLHCNASCCYRTALRCRDGLVGGGVAPRGHCPVGHSSCRRPVRSHTAADTNRPSRRNRSRRKCAESGTSRRVRSRSTQRVLERFSKVIQGVLVGYSRPPQGIFARCAHGLSASGSPAKGVRMSHGTAGAGAVARTGVAHAGVALWGRPDFFGVDKALYSSDGWKSSINHLRRYSRYSRYSPYSPYSRYSQCYGCPRTRGTAAAAMNGSTHRRIVAATSHRGLICSHRFRA